VRAVVSAAAAGILFGVGLTVSGMVNPAKVIGFLDLFGDWDPSLAFVMGGAVAVTFVGYRGVTRLARPVCETVFNIPSRVEIEPNLVIGGGLFGIGWGLVGLCPGPAFTSLALGRWESWVFVGAMIAGMALFRFTYQLSGFKTQAVRAQTVVEDG